MPVAARQKTIKELLEKAQNALSRDAAFEAERLSVKALQMARQLGDFERMAAIVVPLRDARQRRRDQALSARKVIAWSGPITESMSVNAGCYLVEPPLVGADARRLRIAALHSEVPVAVVCREPLTKLKQWPVVAIGAGMTVRTRVEPPKNQEKPDHAWFTGALEALGEAAIRSIDPALDLPRRIDVILERLDSVPDHDGLHQMLLDACKEAAEANADEVAAPPAAKRTKAKSAHEQG